MKRFWDKVDKIKLFEHIYFMFGGARRKGRKRGGTEWMYMDIRVKYGLTMKCDERNKESKVSKAGGLRRRRKIQTFRGTSCMYLK